MEEFKGSKGRWSYNEKTGTIRAEGGLLAELLINGREDDNGRVMAAAPYLLEALQNCIEWLDIHAPAGSAESICVNEARAAIAKALGKE